MQEIWECVAAGFLWKTGTYSTMDLMLVLRVTKKYRNGRDHNITLTRYGHLVKNATGPGQLQKVAAIATLFRVDDAAVKFTPSPSRHIIIKGPLRRLLNIWRVATRT